MVRLSWLIGAAMLIAGCDGGGPSPKTKSITAANPYQDKLAALGELDRSLALRRAVQDTGEPCKKIESSA